MSDYKVCKNYNSCFHECDRCGEAEYIDKILNSQWIPIKWHDVTEEEREQEGWSDDIAYCLDCTLPDDGDEILLSINGKVYQDTCSVYDGYGLESGNEFRDFDAWMPYPKGYVEEKR